MVRQAKNIVHRLDLDSSLVKQMLDLINLSTEIYGDNPHPQMLVDDLVEAAQITLVMDDGELPSSG